jgi:uncharacterized protein YcfJ
MKSLKTVLLTASLALICTPAWAGHPPAGYDRAKVVHATPVYQTVRYPVDEQVCWDEQVWQQRRPSGASTVVGAIIGGVVGNQFGHGDGRVVATVAGAAIGGTIGHQVARDNYRRGAYPANRTQCEVQRSWRMEQQIAAWDVAYKYRGRVYQTRMPERPGKHILVAVNVAPEVLLAPRDYRPGR